jgi:transposase-like protein
MTEIGNADRQEVGQWINNQAENSHQPFQRRERAMLRFRRMKTLQKFASVHGTVRNHSHGHFRVNELDSTVHRSTPISCFGIQV